MRIHVNTLTGGDIYAAARIAGVTVERAAGHGSRTRNYAFDVYITGSSNHRPNFGTSGGSYGCDDSVYAATWDEWGVFLAVLFDRDPSMTVPRVYESADAYHWQTGGRFANLTMPADTHKQHKWGYVNISDDRRYVSHNCTKCSALTRYMLNGRTFAELQEV